MKEMEKFRLQVRELKLQALTKLIEAERRLLLVYSPEVLPQLQDLIRKIKNELHME